MTEPAFAPGNLASMDNLASHVGRVDGEHLAPWNAPGLQPCATRTGESLRHR